MKKLISRPMHGVIDYTYAVIVPLIPAIAGFKNEENAKRLCRVLGAGAFTYSAVTRAEWGLYKALPFKTHLLIDLSVSLFAAGTPWLFGFAANKTARNALLAIGAAGIMASLFTEAKNME